MSKIQVNEIVNHFDTGAPDCPKGLTVTGFTTFSGGVSIGGTLTYEDVTNIDSVGIITANAGIDISNTIVANNDSTIRYDNDTFHVKVDANNVRGSSAFKLDVDDTNAITIDDNRRIGVGTDNPSRKLHINSGTTDTAMLIESTDADVQINLKDVDSSDGISIGCDQDDFYVRTGLTTERLRITSAGVIQCGTGAVLKAEINNAVSGHQFISQCDDNNNGFEIYQQHGSNTTRNNLVVYGNTGAGNAKHPQFVVRGDGRVSIGTDSPDGLLTVQGDSNDSTAPSIRLKDGSDTREVSITNTSGDFIVATHGVDNNTHGRIKIFESGVIDFDNGGSGGSITNRIRINGNGGVNVGNGVISEASGAGNIVVEEGIYIGAFNGDNQIRSSSAGSGSSNLFIGNAQIQVSSDRRLKENIVDTVVDASEELKKVRVVDFTWNDPSDQSFNNKNARGTWTGVIAQELVDVFPFVVNAPRKEEDLSIDHESEKTWMLNQDQLVPVLIKGFQQALTRIETLEAEVSELRGN